MKYHCWSYCPFEVKIKCIHRSTEQKLCALKQQSARSYTAGFQLPKNTLAILKIQVLTHMRGTWSARYSSGLVYLLELLSYGFVVLTSCFLSIFILQGTGKREVMKACVILDSVKQENKDIICRTFFFFFLSGQVSVNFCTGFFRSVLLWYD